MVWPKWTSSIVLIAKYVLEEMQLSVPTLIFDI